ncbi:MAG TPA: DsbA family protein [Solirubrobacteraceae bacterium]|jgi:2-hydroxychromene-2-carboxylate isomerase
MPAALYYDLGSPYAYLAVARCERVLGDVSLRPVLVGAIFAHRGWGSWGDTDERDPNVAEIERRAATYGLPTVRWPAGWPNNTLHAMRMAVWADTLGAGTAFAHAGFAGAFEHGRDLSDRDTLLAVADAVGLDRAQAAGAIALPEIKGALREATDRAIAAGVQGVPTTVVDGQVFYGDDRLEQAALASAGGR